MGRGRTLAEVGAPERCRPSWSEVVQRSEQFPCTRTKHAAVRHGRNLYILGGRRGKVSLKDFWKLNFDDNYWEKVEVSGFSPGFLQDHSMVEYKDKLYVFGGEISFCNDEEMPLWIFDINENTWRKETNSRGARAPKSLRGHSATVYKDSMFIFGGYQDLRGSNADVWMFHFPSRSWHLVCRSDPSAGNALTPKPRHYHTAVLHDSNIWIFGGLNNLQPSSDFIKFDLEWQTWQQVKTKPGPGFLHSHSAVKYQNKMIIIGGKNDGRLSDNIWLFHFATETWEKLDIGRNQPQPRHNLIALTFIGDVKPDTVDSEANEEEVYLPKFLSSSQKTDKSRKLSSTASKLKLAVSLTALNRTGAYASLINLSDDSLAPVDMLGSETSSLSSQAGDREPFCVFNKRSDLAHLHLQRTRQNEAAETSQNRNQRDKNEDKHSLFATALSRSLQDTTDSDSGVELRETQKTEETYLPKSRIQDDVSLLIIGGMLEGQVSWKQENLALWKLKLVK